MPTERVERKEDMSTSGKLVVMRQGDGDMIVHVIPANEKFDKQHRIGAFDPAVEFCTYAGGGRSPKTHAALLALMEAIQQDNLENPL